MDEIEVKVRPVVDSQDMEALSRELSKQAERIAADTFSRYFQGAVASQGDKAAQAIRGAATSTAAPSDAGPGPSNVWVSGHWRAPPTSRVTSTSDGSGGSGGGGSGGQPPSGSNGPDTDAGGGRGPSVKTTADVADEGDSGGGGGGRGRGRGGRRGRSAGDLMADASPFSGLAGLPNDPLSGVSTSANVVGSMLRGAAKTRAEAIDAGEIAGGAGAMGMLRYANPATLALTLATAGVGKALNESSAAGDKFAGISRDLAYGAMGGGYRSFTSRGPGGTRVFDPSAAAMSAAALDNGGLTPQEMAARERSYATTVGYTRVNEGTWGGGRWRAMNSSVSEGAYGEYVANQRLGIKANDPNTAIALGQASGLFGSGLDRYLSIIAGATQRMAIRGVMLNDQSTFSLLNAFRLTPGLGDFAGERGATAAMGLSESYKSHSDQGMEPLRQLAMARLDQAAMNDSGGTFLGFQKARERLAQDQVRMTGLLGRGLSPDMATLVTRSVMPQATWDEAQAIGQGRHTSFFSDNKLPIDTVTQTIMPDGMNLLSYAAVNAAREARTIAGRPSVAGYEAEKGRSENWDAMFRDAGNFFSSAQAWFAGSATRDAALQTLATEVHKLNNNPNGN